LAYGGNVLALFAVFELSKLPPSGALIAVNTECALPDWSIIMEIDGDQGAVTGQVISGARCSQAPLATTNREALTASTGPRLNPQPALECPVE
jgi:hypothetical protein